MRGLVASAALALAACASLPPPEPPAAAVVDEPFAIAARMSARHDGQGVAAHVDWTHERGRDALAFATPMGTTLARLERDADGASIERADGTVERAPDAATLAGRALGFPLPVESLAWWIRAAPHPGSAHAIERDAAGRVLVLRQDGWSVAYAYDDHASRPVRLLATTSPDLEVRLVIDAWR